MGKAEDPVPASSRAPEPPFLWGLSHSLPALGSLPKTRVAGPPHGALDVSAPAVLIWGSTCPLPSIFGSPRPRAFHAPLVKC